MKDSPIKPVGVKTVSTANLWFKVYLYIVLAVLVIPFGFGISSLLFNGRNDFLLLVGFAVRVLIPVGVIYFIVLAARAFRTISNRVNN